MGRDVRGEEDGVLRQGRLRLGVADGGVLDRPEPPDADRHRR